MNNSGQGNRKHSHPTTPSYDSDDFNTISRGRRGWNGVIGRVGLSRLLGYANIGGQPQTPGMISVGIIRNLEV